MTSFLYIVLVGCVAAAVGQKKCCLPSTWKAVMTNTSQVNGDVLEFSDFFYDYELKMDAQQHKTMKPGFPPTKTYRQVNDYNKGKAYIIPEQGKCMSFPNPLKMFPPCGSESAKYTFIGTGYVGPQDDGLNYFGVRVYDQNLTMTVAMDQESCIPILEGIKGQVGAYPIDVVYFFSNFKSPVTDKSVFKVPSSC